MAVHCTSLMSDQPRSRISFVVMLAPGVMPLSSISGLSTSQFYSSACDTKSLELSSQFHL